MSRGGGGGGGGRERATGSQITKLKTKLFIVISFFLSSPSFQDQVNADLEKQTHPSRCSDVTTQFPRQRRAEAAFFSPCCWKQITSPLGFLFLSAARVIALNCSQLCPETDPMAQQLSERVSPTWVAHLSISCDEPLGQSDTDSRESRNGPYFILIHRCLL
jgi:hypothetical protein